MNKNSIKEFFNKLAPQWDDEMIIFDDVVNCILDEADVKSGKSVLDVACGTGVLIPYYLNRGVKSVTAVDISQEMVKIAQSKFNSSNVKIICEDAEEYSFQEKFDCIIIYNAIPHFTDIQKLINHLYKYLNDNGSLTVCHGMSREMINRHHDGLASDISAELPETDEMAEYFSRFGNVKKISDNRMYLVTGYK